MSAIVQLPTPDGADWGYGRARIDGDRLTAHGGPDMVVTFRDTGDRLEIRQVCDASAFQRIGSRALTDTGLVFGNGDANEQRGELVFVRCDDAEAVEEGRLAGAEPATAYWLENRVKASGDTAVARCRANKWCRGSEDWLVVLRHRDDGWRVAAELRCSWLYDFTVEGDTLAVADAAGLHWYQREEGTWRKQAQQRFDSGGAELALDDGRLAVEESGEITIFEHQAENWEKVAGFRFSPEGRYPSVDLALSGDRLAIGTDQRLGKGQGGVLIYRRHADGEWREELRILNKEFGGVVLDADRLVYPRSSDTLELLRLDRLLAEVCAALAPKGVERDVASLDILWASPVERKRRHFLAALPDGRFGLCTQVKRRWRWLEGDWGQLSDSLPEAWRELLEAAAKAV